MVLCTFVLCMESFWYKYNFILHVCKGEMSVSIFLFYHNLAKEASNREQCCFYKQWTTAGTGPKTNFSTANYKIVTEVSPPSCGVRHHYKLMWNALWNFWSEWNIVIFHIFVILYHIISYHIISYHIILYYIPVCQFQCKPVIKCSEKQIAGVFWHHDT